MTGKKFSGTPCIGEVGSYHAHEGCECASGLPYCMPTYKVARPRNLRPDQGPSNAEVIFYDPGFLAKLRSCRFVTS